MTLTDDRLEEIRAMLDREIDNHGHSFKPGPPTICTSCGGQTWPCGTVQVITACHELLSALDAEHRATIAAEVAANRLWEAYDALQRSMSSVDWNRRTRDQIVGLVPSKERTDGR